MHDAILTRIVVNNDATRGAGSIRVVGAWIRICDVILEVFVLRVRKQVLVVVESPGETTLGQVVSKVTQRVAKEVRSATKPLHVVAVRGHWYPAKGAPGAPLGC